jgi:alanyl-tRNA synthetase
LKATIGRSAKARADPNTEVFYDRGEKWDPRHLGVKLLADDIENDRYIEIWGIVFSSSTPSMASLGRSIQRAPEQEHRYRGGLRADRLHSPRQTPTNFETDLFMPIIQAVEKIAASTKTMTPTG